MKKLTFLLATLLIGGMMFTGCKKDNTPGSDPASKTFKVSYALGNKTTAALGIELVTSDCFKFDVTYTGANGEQVEVKGVTLPWTSPSIDVKAPFKAKIEAKPVYDEAQLPDTFAYGAIPSISKDGAVVMTGGEIANRTKVKFLQIMQESPEELIMKTAYDF